MEKAEKVKFNARLTGVRWILVGGDYLRTAGHASNDNGRAFGLGPIPSLKGMK